jgi:hypothetical protein
MSKKDACYYKVKARYKVWPSAYASGALTKCRKVGAANWRKSYPACRPTMAQCTSAMKKKTSSKRISWK